MSDDWRWGFAIGLSIGVVTTTVGWWLWLLTTRIAAGGVL